MSKIIIHLKSDYIADRVRISIDGKFIHDMPAGEHVRLVRDDLATIFERTIEVMDLNAEVKLD